MYIVTLKGINNLVGFDAITFSIPVTFYGPSPPSPAPHTRTKNKTSAREGGLDLKFVDCNVLI